MQLIAENDIRICTTFLPSARGTPRPHRASSLAREFNETDWSHRFTSLDFVVPPRHLLPSDSIPSHLRHSLKTGAAIAMAEPDNDDGTSLLGEALEKLMGAEDEQPEDEQPEEPIQGGYTMEFHRYMDLPSHIRFQIREEAIDQEISSGTNEHVDWFHPFVTNNNVSRLAPVSKEWQKHIEDYLFEMIRIDPTVEGDVLKFKELFKNHRRRYLRTLDVIVDDQPTGPWHTGGGMLQISLAMEKVGQFLSYLISWDSDENEDLDSSDSGENESLSSLDSDESEDLDSGDSSKAASIITWDFGEVEGLKINFVSLNLDFPEVQFAPKGEPSIQTSSLWTASQLNLLTSSDLTTEIPLPPISFAFPKRFGIARHLTFPLDCVPLPATIAIMQTMPNLKSCSFELSFKSSSEEGMARLTGKPKSEKERRLTL